MSEQPFQILASCNQRGFDVDLPESAKSEPTQAVPVLGFPEERFDPDLPLGHRLLVGRGLVVGTHAVEVLSVQRLPDLASLVTLSAGSLQRARVTRRRLSLVDHDAFGVLGGLSPEHLAFRAAELVALGIVGEARGAVEGSPLVEIRQRDVGADALILDRRWHRQVARARPR